MVQRVSGVPLFGNIQKPSVRLVLGNLVLSDPAWSRGWTKWTPVMSSNLSHAAILCFCEPTLRSSAAPFLLPANIAVFPKPPTGAKTSLWISTVLGCMILNSNFLLIQTIFIETFKEVYVRAFEEVDRKRGEGGRGDGGQQPGLGWVQLPLTPVISAVALERQKRAPCPHLWAAVLIKF